MTTYGIVEYDPGAGTFVLPAEHAACLTRAAAPDNIAATFQLIPTLGQVEDRIVECFERGGGVAYACYPRFHEVMAEDSYQTVVACLEERVLPLVRGLRARLEAGIDVLDVGCGRARAAMKLAGLFPRSRFVAYDLSEEAIEVARHEAERRGLDNLALGVVDCAALDEPAGYDLVTAFDAVHDQADPAGLLRSVSRALRDDGVFLMQDIKMASDLSGNMDNPIAPLVYSYSTMHCMTVSLARDGAGLGAAWGRQLAERMLREAGFGRVEVRELPHDIQNYWYVVRK